MQVLLSGRDQTEVVNVQINSPGKTLYQAIQKRSGILVPFKTLMHGVNIVRYSVLLQEQGIHHLSTVFILPVLGVGGGRTRLGNHLEVRGEMLLRKG